MAPIEDYPYHQTDREEIRRNQSPEQSIEVNKTAGQIMAEGPEICQRVSDLLFKSAEFQGVSSNQFNCVYNTYQPITQTVRQPDFIRVVHSFTIAPGQIGTSRVTGVKESQYISHLSGIFKREKGESRQELLMLRRILSEFER